MFLRMRVQCCVSMKRFPSADHSKISIDLLLYNVQGRFATKSRNVYGPFEPWRTWQVFLQLPEYRFLLWMHSHCQEHKFVPSFISMHCFYYLPVSGTKEFALKQPQKPRCSETNISRLELSLFASCPGQMFIPQCYSLVVVVRHQVET